MIEDAMAFERGKLCVQDQRPDEMNRHLSQIYAKTNEANFTHQSVPRLIPELAAHVEIVCPGLVFRFCDDTRHHFGDINLTIALHKQGENLNLGRKAVMVKNSFGIDSHDIRIREASIAFRSWLVDVRFL